MTKKSFTAHVSALRLRPFALGCYNRLTHSISHVGPSVPQGRGVNGDTVQRASDHAAGLRMDKLSDPVSMAPGCPWGPAGSWIQPALGQWRGSCPCLPYPFGKSVTRLQSICSEQILARSLDQALTPTGLNSQALPLP